jgi:ubiquinone/menaquinone biosynthesis C-methylase UbiE
MDKRKFLNPRLLVEEVRPNVNDVVADFGSGSGALTVELARLVGSGGSVTAIDVQSVALESVRSNASIAGVRNIKTVLANLESPQGSTLRDESQDLVLLANILFQSDDKPSIISEAKRVLKPGGRLVVIDWLPSESPLGPKPEHSLKPEDVKSLVGLELDRSLEMAGSYHFGFVFRK